MQRVPESLLQVGVEYRIHMNVDGEDGALDSIGTLVNKVVFPDGDVRYRFDHVIEPVHGAPHINGEVEHRRLSPQRLRSIDPETHTFFVTARNRTVRQVIAKTTGRSVQNPLLTQYFGRMARKPKTLSKKRKVNKSRKK
jgi:hypothetical protein